MRIKCVRIVNFRGFEDQLIELDPYTAFVGPNGAGKSTVLAALNVFFREVDFASTDTVKLSAEDFNNKNTTKPIEITVTFDELSEQAQQDFKDYYRQNELAITALAEFDSATSTATVKQYGERNVIEHFAPYFEALKAGVLKAELEVKFEEICKNYPDIKVAKPRTKDAMRDALRAFEEKNPGKCKLLRSPDNFYGFSSATDKLSKYVQWVYVPAVRDAADESADTKTTALGKLLLYSVKSKTKFDEELNALRAKMLGEYKQIVDQKQESLKELSASLTKRLSSWAHPGATANLVWENDAESAVRVLPPSIKLFAGESGFEGDLARFGHGFQRSYLLAVLQELADTLKGIDTGGQSPTLILACEEPELFQHPPQTRHLAAVFQELSAGNSQVIVTTHSPYFVFGQHFGSVRVTQRATDKNSSSVTGCKIERIAQKIAEARDEADALPISAQQAKLQQALQPRLSEMFFADRVVLVEGIEDVSMLTSWLIETGKWDYCRGRGLHFVPVDGKNNFVEPIVLARAHGIPHFVVFDGDATIKNEDQRRKHEKDNQALLRLMGGDVGKPFPDAVVLTSRYNQWPSNIGSVLRAEVGNDLYNTVCGKVRNQFGEPKASFKKNPMFVGAVVSELVKTPDRPMWSIDALCEQLMKFCGSQKSN